MLQAPEKSLLFEEVSEILQFMKELELGEYTVYSKLTEVYESQ